MRTCGHGYGCVCLRVGKGEGVCLESGCFCVFTSDTEMNVLFSPISISHSYYSNFHHCSF